VPIFQRSIGTDWIKTPRPKFIGREKGLERAENQSRLVSACPRYSYAAVKMFTLVLEIVKK
jgi:hypothetical protein